MSIEYQREIEIATKLARDAGAILLRHYYSPFLVEQKVNALKETEEVTAADREANEEIEALSIQARYKVGDR